VKPWNPITVVKLGGSLLEDAELRGRAIAALAARWIARESLVVVHGGGKRIDAALGERNIPKKTYGGFRITDAATLDVVVAVLAGLVNKSLVADFSQHSVFAAGLSAADGGTLSARFHSPIDNVDLGYVGEIVAADTRLITTVAQAGYLPVISSVALGPDGTLLNLNADIAAAALDPARVPHRCRRAARSGGEADRQGARDRCAHSSRVASGQRRDASKTSGLA